MESIRHRVVIHAPIGEVYEAVSTKDGVAGWWTRETEGTDGIGGKLAFSFGGDTPVATMEIVELTAPDRVVWKCLQGPDEWVGARLTFDLCTEDGKTVLLFSHDGWENPGEPMHDCTTAWGYYLYSLRAGLESDAGRPFPDNTKQPLEVAP